MKHLALALLLVALGASMAVAQSSIGLNGVGFELVAVNPDNMDSAIGFGVTADFGTIAPNFGLETYIDYWSSSEDVIGGGEFSARDIILGAKSKYYFAPTNPSIQPFVGAGLGLHVVKAEISAPSQDLGTFIIPGTSIEDTSSKLGLDFGGGIATAMGAKSTFQAEAWYSIVSDISQLSLKLGLMFPL